MQKVKAQYGDFVEIIGEGKPEDERLKEIILVLTEQMISSIQTIKADIHNSPITFIIRQDDQNPEKWTVGWKAILEVEA